MTELKKDSLKLKIDEKSGRMAYFGREENLLSDSQPPLFGIRFIKNGEKQVLTAGDAGKITVQSVTDNGAEIVFSDFAEEDLAVRISVCIENGEARFRAAAESTKQLEWIEFPGVAVKDTFKGKGSGKLLFPYNEGVLIDDIDFRDMHGFGCTDPEYPSEGKYTMCPGMVSTPFMAVTGDTYGLYFAAHDPGQNTRHLDFCRYNGGIQLKMRLYPGVNGGNYKTDSDTVLSVFTGDWYSAAELYRSWFEKCSAKGFVKAEENSKLPKWYSDSPLTVAYAVRGHHDTDDMKPNKLFPYVNAMPVLKNISDVTGSPVMALLMHWEGTAPWAPPYVWPPYGGEKALGEFVKEMHKAGNSVGVYCSGLGWTQKSNVAKYSREEEFEEKELSRFMCTAPDGSLPLSKICTGQRSGYDMCPATEFCKETMAREAGNIINADIDYIQLMDQNHGGTPYFCYSDKHSHPPVPGKWESDALKDILSEIKKTAGDKKYLLGCESAAAETFIPQMLFSDNRFELNFMLGMPVPLYSYLYHTYLNNFMGNQVCGSDIMDCVNCRDNLLYRMAYSFTAGDFLTVIINDEGNVQWSWGQRNFDPEYMPDTEQTLRFAGRLNAWRRSFAAKYLHTGKMQRPYKTAEQTTHKMTAGKRTFEVPDVLTAAYVSSEGKYGQIFVNYTDKDRTVTLEYGGEMTFYSSPDSKGESIQPQNGFTVPAESAVLLEEKCLNK